MKNAAPPTPTPLSVIAPSGLTVKNLTLSYLRHPAVHHLSGEFAKGSMTAVMGPNGGGKSTLIKALAALHPVDEGQILRAPDHNLSSTAYLAQNLSWDRQFPMSVWELASQALLPELGLWKKCNSEQIDRVEEALKKVQLMERRHESIGNLSLGQFQRALFARVIVQKAQVILLDEPFTGLDEKSVDSLFEIMHQWNREGKTQIVVLHDRHWAHDHFPRTLILSREAKAWGPTQDVLEPYLWKQVLLQSPIPDSHEECHQ